MTTQVDMTDDEGEVDDEDGVVSVIEDTDEHEDDDTLEKTRLM